MHLQSSTRREPRRHGRLMVKLPHGVIDQLRRPGRELQRRHHGLVTSPANHRTPQKPLVCLYSMRLYGPEGADGRRAMVCGMGGDVRPRSLSSLTFGSHGRPYPGGSGFRSRPPSGSPPPPPSPTDRGNRAFFDEQLFRRPADISTFISQQTERPPTPCSLRLRDAPAAERI